MLIFSIIGAPSIITSEINLEYSAIFEKYGYMFAKAKLSLDQNDFLTFNGELKQMFNNALQLNFALQSYPIERMLVLIWLKRLSKINNILFYRICKDWSVCRLRFTNKLKDGDVIKLNVSLLDNNGKEVEEGTFIMIYQYVKLI